MPKQKKLKHIFIHVTLGALLLGSFVMFGPVSVGRIQAATLNELREQSAELEKEISQNSDQASKLRKRGDSLKNQIELLDARIKNATQQIKLTELRIAELEKELSVAEAELERQKTLLRASMVALYKRGDASIIELIIGSDSFSQFMDEQEYLERLKLGIQDSAEKVVTLKLEIQEKQNEQKDLKDQQEAQRALIEKTRDEQAQLLAETKGQESLYKARTEKLRKAQAKILSEIVSRSQVITGVGTGAYPWADYRAGSWTHADSCSYGDDIDLWGYCYRQCVSFAAWRLYSEGKKPPKYYGNAENWDDAAKANRVPTGSKPKVGAIAVWEGNEGHVAYVEEIYEDGRVRISEYNAVPALKGKYSQRIINADDPAAYIYFK